MGNAALMYVPQGAGEIARHVLKLLERGGDAEELSYWWTQAKVHLEYLLREIVWLEDALAESERILAEDRELLIDVIVRLGREP